MALCRGTFSMWLKCSRIARVIVLAIVIDQSYGHVASRQPSSINQSQSSCSVSESEWTVHSGGFAYVNDIHAFADDDIWAVGVKSIAHYDGATWKSEKLIDSALYALDFDSHRKGWAVGYKAMYRFGSGVWSKYNEGFDDILYDIDVVSESNAWAVGKDGKTGKSVIYGFDGSEWSLSQLDSHPAVHSVSFIDKETGWAVGEQGTILMFNAGHWSAMATPTNRFLSSVVAVASNDVWAVGGDSQHQPANLDEEQQQVILHFDGNRWLTVVDQIGWSLLDITFNEVGGWAVGRMGVYFHFDGIEWVDLGVAGKSSDYIPHTGLRSISRVPGRDYLVAGTDQNARVVMISATGWSVVKPGTGFSGIQVVGSASGWTVGHKESVWRFDARGWYPYRAVPNAESLVTLLALEEDNVWAAGMGGTMAHFDGTIWEAIESNTTGDVIALDKGVMLDVWALARETFRNDAGQLVVRSYVLRFRNDQWHIHTQLDSRGWTRDLSVVAEDDIWVVGDDGGWRFDGTKWQLYPITNEANRRIALEAIEMLSPHRGWAGGNGYIFSYGNERWDIAFNSGKTVSSIAVDTESNIWTAGFWGYVYFFDKSRWNIIEPYGGSGSSVVTLNDIQIVRENDNCVTVWVVGAYDTIMSKKLIVPKDNTEPTVYPTAQSTAVPSVTPSVAPARRCGSPNCIFIPAIRKLR